MDDAPRDAVPRRSLGAGVSALLRSTAFRVAFLVCAVGLAVWALASRRTEVLAALTRMDRRLLLAAVLATVANLGFTALSWRAILTDLGSRLPLAATARVFFVGQVGKYLPGSLWPVVVQAELGSDHGVPRRRSAAATLVLILLSAFSALLVVLVCLPFVPAVAEKGFEWTLLLVAPLLVVLHPAVLGRLLDRALRAVGRPPLGEWTSMGGTAIALGWALLSWACAGLQVWFLTVSLGAPADGRTLALAVGGYALAWALGLMVVVAPAGAGAREVALGALLSTVLDGGAVLVVVLLSRVLFTVADLTLAAIGFSVGRHREPAQQRPVGVR